jgi:PST family polysaccharide transporter
MSTVVETYFQANAPHSGLGKAAMRGGSWVLFAQGITLGLRVASSIILARLLVPADFGLYATVAAVLSGLGIFKDLGLSDAIIQWPDLTDRQMSSLFWLNLGISGLVVACLAAVSSVFGAVYGDSRMPWIVVAWSFTIFFGALSAQHLALLKRSMHFAGVSKLSMLAAAISNIGSVTMAWFGGAYWALVFRDVAYEALLAIGAWIHCRWRPQSPSRPGGIGPMLAFGGHSITSYIVRRTSRNMDRALLGWKFGPAATGQYHMAFELSGMLTSLIVEPLRNVAVWSLSKLRDQPAQFKEYFLKALQAFGFVCLGCTAVLMALGDDLATAFLGPKWQGAGDILRIFGLAAGVSAIYMTNTWLHFALGRADRLAKSSIWEALLIGAAVCAGLSFGVYGVAWGYNASMCILCIGGLWYAGRPIGLSVRELLAALWRPAVAAAVAGGVCGYAMLSTGIVQSPAVRIVLYCISFSFLYVSIFVLLSGGIEAVREYVAFAKECVAARRERPAVASE